MLTPALKNYFFYTGLVLLALAILVTVSSLSGLVTLPETFLGNESTIHSVARIAVLGCVLAAIGSQLRLVFRVPYAPLQLVSEFPEVAPAD